MTRRTMLLCALPACAAAAAALTAGHDDALAGPRRRMRRRVRRRVRRRIRRRVAFRTVAGKRHLVVPVGVAVGWELMVDQRVVVVQKVQGDSIVVAAPGGAPETIVIIKEDTPENTAAQQGSVLPDGDTTTPATEAEEEVEVEE